MSYFDSDYFFSLRGNVSVKMNENETPMSDLVALSKVPVLFLCEEKEELLIAYVHFFSHHRITTNIGFFFP